MERVFPCRFFWHHVRFGNQTKNANPFFYPQIIVSSSPAWFQPGWVHYCPSRPPWGKLYCTVWSALRGREPWGRWLGAGPKSPRRRCHPERRSLRGWSPCEHRWSCKGLNLEEKAAAEWLVFVAVSLCVCVCFYCVCVVSPMSTEKKKMGIGMLRTGQVMLRNQFGVMGKKRRKRRKKNKLRRFSSTFCLGEGKKKKRGQEKEEKGQRCEKMRENIDESSHTASPGSFLWRI